MKQFDFLKSGEICILHKNIVLTLTSSVYVTCSGLLFVPSLSISHRQLLKMPMALFSFLCLFSPMKWLTYWPSSPNLYFRFFVLTCLDVWDFSAFFFTEISLLFSLYHLTSFLETPKAHGMTQGSLVSLLAPICPGTSLWHRWKPPLPGSQNPFYL